MVCQSAAAVPRTVEAWVKRRSLPSEKPIAGVPAATIKGLLDSARKLQDQLAAGGESSPELRRSQAEAQMAMTDSLLTAGDTAGALAGLAIYWSMTRPVRQQSKIENRKSKM